MEQRPNDAAEKDVRTKLSEEECVLDMAQQENTNDAALKDAQL